jgi:hypothetical protein
VPWANQFRPLEIRALPEQTLSEKVRISFLVDRETYNKFSLGNFSDYSPVAIAH